MKALSLVLAIVLWQFVRGEQQIQRNLSVKLKVTNEPTDLIVAGEPLDPTINIRVIGPRSRLTRIDEDFLGPYVLDLSDARKGVNTFWIHEEDFRIPRSARISRISPQVIRIVLDRAEERLVKVEPKFVGELEEGFDLVRYEVIPAFVKVRGARSELASLNVIKTENVSLTGQRGSFEGDFVVKVPGQEAEERKVLVKVTIREREVSRILEDVPVVVAGVKGYVKVEPSTVSLRAKGPAGKIASLLGEKVMVEIDGNRLKLDQRKKKQFHIRPAPPSRPGIEITMVPDNVLVTITHN